MQKFVQVHLSDTTKMEECIELPIQKYINAGWESIAFQVCPRGDGKSGDVVFLLQKYATDGKPVNDLPF